MYISNIFFWNYEWNKKALKIEKQLKQKSEAVSQLSNEKQNHGDLFNHIYLKLIHTKLQAFQRWWAPQDIEMR